jgi:hypothetical protein
MEDKKNLIVAYVALVGVIVGSAAFFFTLLPQRSTPEILLPGGLGETPKGKTEVKLYKKQGSLVLNWANLPQGTERVDIFRALRGTKEWVKWQSVAVAELGINGGNIEIPNVSREDLDTYSFYAQAVGNYIGQTGTSTAPGLAGGPSESGGQLGVFLNSEGETVLWISEEVVAEEYVPPPPPPSPPTSPTTPASNNPEDIYEGQMIPPISVPQSTSTTGAPTGQTSSSQSQTVAPIGQSGGSPNQIIYYTPSGGISGYGTVQEKKFWVDHVNKNIELGWQGIPASSTLVIVYRSQSQTGGWAELMRQKNPESSYLLRLLDNTFDQAHYYKLEARSGNTVLQTYGPEFLPAFTE